MTKSKIAVKKKTSPKNDMALEITGLLKPVFEKLKKALGEKKLEKRIKKAAKLMVHGIKTATAEKKPVKKTATKKVTKKKSIPSASKKIPLVKPAK